MQSHQNENIVFELFHHANEYMQQYKIMVDEEVRGIVIVAIKDSELENINSFDAYTTWTFFNDYEDVDVIDFINLREKEVVSSLVDEWIDKGFEFLVHYTSIIINGRDIFFDKLGCNFSSKVINDKIKNKD